MWDSLVGLLIAATALLAACDDQGPTGAQLDAAVDRDSATDSAVVGDSDLPPDTQIFCFDHSMCAVDEYCDLPPGGFNGICRRGCRIDEPESWPEDQICVETDEGHVLEPIPEEPCRNDRDCEESEQFCAESGECRLGCRMDPNNCPPDGSDDNRAQDCRENEEGRTCEPRYVCCGSGASICTREFQDECDGLILENTLDCTGDPCVDVCQDGDEDCPPDKYCNEDKMCEEGCRVEDPAACPPGEICDPGARVCRVVPCTNDEMCPAGKYCRISDGAEEGECTPGCRGDDDCDEGQDERCDGTHRCRTFCDEENPCRDPDKYCDLRLGSCRPPCLEHDECDIAETCTPESRCEVGCRDDRREEPNNDFASATSVGIVDGSGQMQGRTICPDDRDHYAFEVPEGWRIWVTLTFDPAAGDLRLNLYDASQVLLEQRPNLGSPKDIIFPPRLDDPHLLGGTYHVRVEGADRTVHVPGSADSTTEAPGYTLEVAMVPPRDPSHPDGEGPLGCFPDRHEPHGDYPGQANDPADAIRIGVQERERFTDLYVGTICQAGDVDWFEFPMSVQDGLTVEIRTEPGSDGLIGEIYSAFGLHDLVHPMFSTDECSADGERTLCELVVPAESGQFRDGNYYLRVRGLEVAESDRDGVGEYELEVDFVRAGVPCVPDHAEPNDEHGASFALGNGGVVPANQELTIEALSLCSGETDYFRLEAETNDTLEIAVDIEDEAGDDFVVALVDNLDSVVGATGQGDRGRVEASFVGATQGSYHVRVSGVGPATARYRLNVLRNRGANRCEDPAEAGAPRNDTHQQATMLEPSGDGATRFALENGRLCNLASSDIDWYCFNVAENRSRIAVVADFTHENGNVDMWLYRRQQLNEGEIEVPIAESATQRDGELINVQKALGDAGDYCIKVASPNGDENTYNLTITVVPEDPDTCPEDYREQNDVIEDAHRLGGADVRVGDAWACVEEGDRDHDWFRLSADRHDRTIHVEYRHPGDGRLNLFAWGPDIENPGRFLPIASSREIDTGAQCVNVRHGQQPRVFYIQLWAASRIDDNDLRVDYVLQVVDTDLDVNPRGQCDILNDGAYEHVEWPTVNLP